MTREAIAHWGATLASLGLGIMFGMLLRGILLAPYRQLKRIYKKTKNREKGYGPWAIGIYEGITPFDLTDQIGTSNPILTGREIHDIDAVFVADPFLLTTQGKYYLFFEAMNRASNRGDIGYADSMDGRKWTYRKIVIQEKFHLSYPYVFEWNREFYLIPESAMDLSVRLYRAISFPDQWQHVGNLMSGYRFLDPSVFRHGGVWWLLVATGDSNVLNLYHSKELLGEWKPHPKNPIVKLNARIARPAGRVISFNNKLYRFAQDDELDYGTQVWAFEIVALTEESYEERAASEEPLIKMSGRGWNAAGMHTVDLHNMNGKWVAAVDGKCKPEP